MLLLTYIREHNEIPICDDVFKHVLLPFFTIYDLLKIVTTNKQFKKLIQNIIPDHPYNLHNAIWEGPILTYHYCSNICYHNNPFILPENPQNYIWVGANLEGTSLINANLFGANLFGANLFGANLYRANLRGADLKNANLTDANLRGADLTGANLTGADLNNADLWNANITGADLTDADLNNAYINGAKTNDPIFHKKYPETILV
jgi:uncharacterized protein YjbI with pentapeptide repeats